MSMSDRLNFWNRKGSQGNSPADPIPNPSPAPVNPSPVPVRAVVVPPAPKRGAEPPPEKPATRPALRRRLGLKPTQVRTIYVSIALSQEERDYLMAYCDKYEVSFSGWLREVALNAARRPPVASAPSRRRTARVRAQEQAKK